MSESTIIDPTVPIYTTQRTERNDYATYGEIRDPSGSKIVVCLELPWKDNIKNDSCFPARPDLPYLCEYRYSNDHHLWLWGYTDIAGRDDCEIHIGDLPSDSKGCQLVGMDRGYVEYPDGRKGDGIVQSHTAFDKWMNATKGLKKLYMRVVDPA